MRAATETVVLYDSAGQEVDLGINGDVILEADGKPIESGSDLTDAIVAAGVGKSMSLKVWREGKTIDLKVAHEIIK